MRKFAALLKTEGKLNLRCPDGLIFGIAMPVGILLLIGAVAGNKAVFPGADYTFLKSAFSALITVGICATAFMGIPLTIADYRDKKILKHFFVTPASPFWLLTVQVVLAAVTAAVSALAVTLVSVICFGYRMDGSIPAFLGAYVVVMVSMYSIGLLIASVCRTVKMANVVCSLIYFPMLFLSGATIPYELFPKGLQRAADFLPLTQGVKLLKEISLGSEVGSLIWTFGILAGVAVLGILGSVVWFRWE